MRHRKIHNRKWKRSDTGKTPDVREGHLRILDASIPGFEGETSSSTVGGRGGRTVFSWLNLGSTQT